MAGATTGRILFGMLVGAIIGVALMYVQPVPLQPGDVVELQLTSGTTEQATVADTVVSSTDPRAGTLGEDGKLIVAGLQAAEALAAVRDSGVAAAALTLKERASMASVQVMPPITQVFYVIGQLFIKLLKMLIVPLIIATVLVGVAGLGDLRRMGRLGKHTILIYFGTMLVAATIGLLFVALIRPGSGLDWPIEDGDQPTPTVSDLILRVVPDNPVAAMAQLDVIGILFFTILVGIAILKLGKHRAAPVFNFFESLNDIVYVLVGWVMWTAPLGVGALIAYFVGIQVPEYVGMLLQSLGKFALCVVLGLVTQFLLLTLLVATLGKYSPTRFVAGMSPAIATALGTDSSSATMPVTMTCVRNVGVSKRIAGFVVPVGATANMDGTALYEATAALFFAQAYGINLSFGQEVLVVFTAVAAAVGAAGIPSAGLVTMALVLTAVGLPLEGIALLFAIDRPLDMMRTVVNVYGDGVASRLVQTWNPDIKPEEDDIATAYEEIEPAAAHGD
jgi:Na+/H+-dicarboxylate symporter